MNSGYLYKERMIRQKLTAEYAKAHPRALYDDEPNGNYSDDTAFTSGLSVNYGKNDWIGNFTSSYIYSREDYDRKKDIGTAGYYKSARTGNDYKAATNGGRTMRLGQDIANTVTVGADYRYRNLDYDKTYPNDPGQNKVKDYFCTKTSVGASINDEIVYKIFSLSGGLRWNYVKYDVDYDSSSSNKDFEKKYDRELDWNISFSEELFKDSNLFISYNHSKAYESSFPTNNSGNTSFPRLEDLKPETINTLELGFKHQLNEMLNYSVVYYRTGVDDKVVTYYVPDGSGGYTSAGTYNAGETMTEGVEIELSGRGFSNIFGYNGLENILGYRFSSSIIKAEWQNGKQKDSDGNWQNLKGKQINRIPTYEYTAGIDIYPFENESFGSLVVSFDVHGFSKFYNDDLNSADGEKKNAYFLNSRLDYSYENIGVFLRCTNLLDKYYFQGITKGFTYEGRYIGGGVTAKI